ncbi:MAG: MotA/TolQ/ExbB proton channel family protein, partial [Pirellulales bacterium]
LWGGLATLGFYWSVPHLPVYRELAQRYFCAHPVEYVQTALFFVGLSILLRKLLDLRSQRSALLTSATLAESAPARPDATADDELQPNAASSLVRDTLSGWLSQLTGAQRRSGIAQRLTEISRYVQQRPDADAVEQQLKDLEDRAGDDLHDSYALLQTIIWAIPIMGFLGTVLGITVAIANLDVNQLDSSLSAVTFNLAVAFDTTAVALSHSLILVFLYLFAKRSEERVYVQVGEFCRCHILSLIPGAQPHTSPLLAAESAAARQLVERTGELIDAQTQLWSESIEALRKRWTGTLDAQQQSLTQALESGTQASLGQHADHLADLRGEFVQALGQLSRQRAEAEAALRAQEAALVGRWEAGTDKLASVLGAAQQAADDRT